MKVKSEEEIIIELCRGEDYKKILENGTPEQQYKLAECLSKDYMHAKIRILSINLYKKAADAGHVESSFQFFLRTSYDYGKKPALKYLKFAAEKGHIDAKLDLARCYIIKNLPGCKKENKNEEKKSFEVVKELAEKKKNKSSYSILAWCYEIGRGTEMDLEKAKKYYKLMKSSYHIERVEMLIREREKPNKRTREMIVKKYPLDYTLVDDKLVAL
jgi:TPR repeat protein